LLRGVGLLIAEDQDSRLVLEEHVNVKDSEFLTPKEAAQFLRVNISWLAKSRMRGDGPVYVKLGRSVRYSQTVLLQWLKSRQRFSTAAE
jgi:predicted DNA-binding transcriptional regulator AlpA